jgi:hypothetical protein
MTQKRYVKLLLILAFLCVTLGGFLLHARAHPPGTNPSFFVPFLAGLFSLTAIAALYSFRRGVPYGYVLNGMLAIIGTITMTHISLANWPEEFTLLTPIMNTLLPDIIILWTAFFIGKLIFELEMTNVNNLDSPRHKGRFLRYPNMGYWFVHLFALSAVYTLGHLIWK